MTQYGYDKQRFPNLTGEMFDCSICTNVVKKPKQCLQCGDLFCAKCIDDWMKKNNSCPKRCTQGIQFMTSKALIKIYNQINIKCQKCPKTLCLGDLEKHQANCGLPKCWNFEICASNQSKSYKNACSQKCSILFSIVQTKGNIKQIYQILKRINPMAAISDSKVVSNGKGGSISNISLDSALRWSRDLKGDNLIFEDDGKLVMLRQSAYVFRTAISSQGFTSGQHYWEIIPDSRTQNQLKIGVCSTTGFDFNTAFCDHQFGFAYYGLGQLRHGSNSSGGQYGKRLKKQGILGVYLNMQKGQLSFSLNGENMGVAFESAGLKSGTIYPAVALLHCAGCTIKGQLPIPSIFK